MADSVETVATETTEEIEEIIVEQAESETEVTLDNAKPSGAVVCQLLGK